MQRGTRREDLLRAALDVIRRDGPSASMDSMAAEAGITKPILYRHFGDRDGLIWAVANRFGDSLVDTLASSLATPEGPRERIASAVRAYVDFIEADPALYLFLSQRDQVSSAIESGVIERVAAVLDSAMGAAIAAAGLPPRSTETWAYGVVGMMHLAAARWASNPLQPKDALVEDLVSLVSDGLIGSVFAAALPSASVPSASSATPASRDTRP